MKNVRSLCVFCGSRLGADTAFAEAAEALGRCLAERGVRLVYGGGSIGLMGVVMQALLASLEARAAEQPAGSAERPSGRQL